MKKVLVTFDYNKHPGFTTDDTLLRDIITKIPNSKVKVFLPNSKKSVDDNAKQIEKEMHNSDLIIHDGLNFQKSVPYSEDAVEFEKKLTELVFKRFKEKSVFFHTKPKEDNPIQKGIKKDTAHLSIPPVDPENPVFPLVIKLDSHGGRGIYLIEDKETFDKALNSGDKAGPKKQWFSFSKYIETPSDYFTHYRLLFVRDKLIGAGLIVSNHKKTDGIRRVEEGKYELGSDMLECCESPYFLNSKKITSNAVQEGRIIPLNNGRELKEWEKKVLREHNLNPEKTALHKSLLSKSLEAARSAEKNGFIIQGQDWLQDKEGNFHLLEINHLPEMKLLLHLFNKGKGTHKDICRIGGREIAKRLHRTVK